MYQSSVGFTMSYNKYAVLVFFVFFLLSLGIAIYFVYLYTLQRE